MIRVKFLKEKQVVGRFEVTGDRITLLEGDESVINEALTNQSRTRKDKESFLKYQASGMGNAVSLQEGTGIILE